jgi:hypothetical protein
MPMRNRTRIVAVSPEVNDVDVGAAQKQQAPTGTAAARKHGGSRVASHGGDATRHLLQGTMGSWRSCCSWASMAGEDAGLQGKKLTKGRCCEGEGRSVHGRQDTKRWTPVDLGKRRPVPWWPRGARGHGERRYAGRRPEVEEGERRKGESAGKWWLGHGKSREGEASRRPQLRAWSCARQWRPRPPAPA